MVEETVPIAVAEGQIDLSGDGGVQKKILQEGVGDETPSPGCKVSLHYTGTLTDGTKFDSSLDRNEPFEFELGKGVVVKAFDLGIATMKKGEKAILTCAPEYAYGAGGSPPNIPPNATLLFEVSCLATVYAKNSIWFPLFWCLIDRVAQLETRRFESEE